MKQLQNNFTTPEQSKRLLELGLPADSADCYIRTDTCAQFVSTLPFKNSSTLHKKDVLFTEFEMSLKCCDISCVPCWSAGRLIEIMALCYKFYLPDSGSIQIYTTDIKKGTVVDILISDIERFINKIDFSKLEE